MKDKAIASPEVLTEISRSIEDLRADFLDDVERAGVDPEAEQLFLTGLATLEIAQRQMTLASLKQSQALAASGKR
jgi:hypothetical protein